MKVYVYTAGLDGCGFYRMIWPGQALAAAGHDVTVVLPNERDHDRYQLTAKTRTNADGTDDIVDAIVPEDADVVVLQRVTHTNLSRSIEHIRARGVAVVVDMDDDLSHVHPSNPAYPWMHPRNGTAHNWDNAAAACRAATWVTTSTPALQKIYARPGAGTVLYNMIERRALTLPSRDEGYFGWTGSLRSHPDDPQVMGNSVQRLVREGHRFYMVGNAAGVAQELRLDEEQVARSAQLSSVEWMDALSVLHVGVAPLNATLFNQSKSWLKPLELAAVGVPTVMSPRVEYRRLHADGAGVGVLAPRPKDFYRETRRLLTDDAWHAEVVERGRLTAGKMTVEDNAWRWMEVWEQAYRAERAGRHALVR